MSGYPTHTRSTPEDVFIFYVEHKPGCSIEANGIATVDMDHSLWLAGTTTGVQNVEGILTVHWLTGDDGIIRDVSQQIVPVKVATCFHRDINAKPSNDDHLSIPVASSIASSVMFLSWINFPFSIKEIMTQEYVSNVNKRR
jgi:hypothetical protein